MRIGFLLFFFKRCMKSRTADILWIKSKDDLKRYSLEKLEKMCPKDKRLFVRFKKLKAIYG